MYEREINVYANEESHQARYVSARFQNGCSHHRMQQAKEQCLRLDKKAPQTFQNLSGKYHQYSC